MAALSSENLLLMWEAFRNRRIERLALLAALGLGTAYLLVTQLAVVVGQASITERFPYRYNIGLESADEFLRRTTPSYAAFRFLEEHAQGPVKILSLGNEFRLYTTAQIYGPLFSKEAFDVLHDPADGDALAENLKKLGYTHILLYWPEIEIRPQVYTSKAFDEAFLARYTRLIYDQNRLSIYLLVDDPLDAGQGFHKKRVWGHRGCPNSRRAVWQTAACGSRIV